jgi:hypothetical protein
MGFLGFFLLSLGMLTVCTLAKYYSRSVSSESKFVKTLSFTLCPHQIGYGTGICKEKKIQDTVMCGTDALLTK